MGFNDDGGLKQSRRRNWNRALAPLFGLLLAFASAAIAYILSEPLYTFVLRTFPQVPAAPEVQLVVGIVIFLLCLGITAALYAVVAPKPAKATYVTERELDRLKQERAAEERAKDRRRKEMRRRMRERNRNDL
ncbi:hypothetical protein G4Y79_17565 [Phototrophicus methaneseepsis]|uniref:Uncharacterized protein n=1 Tax=Phototrophicus methaneseepsis TaxID=2710758 RepID=A0A7S8E6W5_9CHLR|nr:hypothetical protein [Phototrophicus methaneseepsis]QPC81486.1 hypothetical protein G4Y79_17565 [Phototrophicus methaneseepsis]